MSDGSSSSSEALRRIEKLQRSTQTEVDDHCRKLELNYRALLQRHAALVKETSSLPGRQEGLSMAVAAENIVVHAHRLLDMVQELRVKALVLHQHQLVEDDLEEEEEHD